MAVPGVKMTENGELRGYNIVEHLLYAPFSAVELWDGPRYIRVQRIDYGTDRQILPDSFQVTITVGVDSFTCQRDSVAEAMDVAMKATDHWV